MNEKTERDNQTLVAFWDRAFFLPEEEKRAAEKEDPGSWKDLAPSEKLLTAACALGERKKVLDYGCGSGWAAVAAAKSGCADVTAADAAKNAADAAAFTAKRFGVSDRVRALHIDGGWLKTVPDGTFDGFFCSNVLDVVPPETAAEILREAARIVTPDAPVFIGLNYHLSPEAAADRGIALKDGRMLYMEGVLRMVSRTDEEWAAFFSPFFTVEDLDHFAWPGEKKETRRLFRLRKKAERE